MIAVPSTAATTSAGDAIGAQETTHAATTASSAHRNASVSQRQRSDARRFVDCPHCSHTFEVCDLVSAAEQRMASCSYEVLAQKDSALSVELDFNRSSAGPANLAKQVSFAADAPQTQQSIGRSAAVLPPSGLSPFAVSSNAESSCLASSLGQASSSRTHAHSGATLAIKAHALAASGSLTTLPEPSLDASLPSKQGSMSAGAAVAKALQQAPAFAGSLRHGDSLPSPGSNNLCPSPVKVCTPVRPVPLSPASQNQTQASSSEEHSDAPEAADTIAAPPVLRRHACASEPSIALGASVARALRGQARRHLRKSAFSESLSRCGFGTGEHSAFACCRKSCVRLHQTLHERAHAFVALVCN